MNFVCGPLTSLANDPKITDIAVTSNGRVWVDVGKGMEERHITPELLSPQVVRDLAVQLCAGLGKRLDDASPIADACTSDGVRVHAVLEPIVARGASLSIRLPCRTPVSLDSLCEQGFMPYVWKDFLLFAVRQKLSIMVCGGTGAGKTTLVKALLAHVPDSERVVIVEEIPELAQYVHANSESLIVRSSNAEGAGEVDLSELVRATVRMRPDRIVLGECRGSEVADLLRALNSGHKGSIATIHADSIERLPARLSALGLLAGIDTRAMAMLAFGAFDIVIHVSRDSRGRHVDQIGRMVIDETTHTLRAQCLSSWSGAGVVSAEQAYVVWLSALGYRTQTAQKMSGWLNKYGTIPPYTSQEEARKDYESQDVHQFQSVQEAEELGEASDSTVEFSTVRRVSPRDGPDEYQVVGDYAVTRASGQKKQKQQKEQLP